MGKTKDLLNYRYPIETYNYYTFQQRLYAVRKRNKKRAEDICKACNIRLNHYIFYEKGIIVPPYKHLIRIAKYLEVDFSWLICGHYKDKTVNSLLALVSSGYTKADKAFIDESINENTQSH
jgi:transcriptional regulator with XRE-family HTH domain